MCNLSRAGLKVIRPVPFEQECKNVTSTYLQGRLKKVIVLCVQEEENKMHLTVSVTVEDK